jgi:hypothetical protein
LAKHCPLGEVKGFKKVLEPKIARAESGDSVLLFMDGVQFVQAVFPGTKTLECPQSVQHDHGATDHCCQRRVCQRDNGL